MTIDEKQCNTVQYTIEIDQSAASIRVELIRITCMSDILYAPGVTDSTYKQPRIYQEFEFILQYEYIDLLLEYFKIKDGNEFHVWHNLRQDAVCGVGFRMMNL